MIESPAMDPTARLNHVCIVSSGAEGALGRSVQRGFEALGRRVTYLPYPDWLPSLRNATFLGSRILSRGLANLTRPALELRLITALAKAAPDLILFVKCDDLHATTYSAIRAATRAPLLAFHPDDPWNQASFTRQGPSHARAEVQIRSVDAMFLWSRALVERASREGAQRAFYLPFAYDPALHPAVAPATDDPEGRERVAREGHPHSLEWTYREWAERMLERCEGWAI